MDDDAVRAAFPELAWIEDGSLREGVVTAWARSMAEYGVDDLEAVPWLPPVQRDLDLPDETLVGHVRDVTACARALHDTLVDRRGVDLDGDIVIAGALVHDVSKLAEFDGMEPTAVVDLLGHPHVGVHLTERAGLPLAVSHIVLAHTDRSAVEPATLEAAIVHRADGIAADAIRWEATDDLRTVG